MLLSSDVARELPRELPRELVENLPAPTVKTKMPSVVSRNENALGRFSVVSPRD